MDASHIRELDAQYVMATYRRQPRVFERGEGVWLYDSDGNRYLDFLAGIAVNQLGHAHPAIVETISRQARTLIHTSNLLLTAPQAELAGRLHELMGADRTFFANCGATANEAAIKIAKKRGAASRPEIVAMERSFHGRTLGVLSATMQPKYQDQFRPLVPGFRSVPANDERALDAVLGSQTAAVIVEPIQGEGGLTELTESYLQFLRRRTTEVGALLIVDEVQTGVGRTGWWLAMQKSGVRPDVVTLAKGLGCGVPIGACMAYAEASDILQPGDHGSTFGGSPFVCAVALTVLETIEREDLLENVRLRGRELADGLASIGSPIVEVRGEGLMRGAVLDRPIARDVVRWALDHGVILNATDDHTLRFVPPLIVTSEHVGIAIEAVRGGLAAHA